MSWTISVARRIVNVGTLVIGRGPTSTAALDALARFPEKISNVDCQVMRVGLNSFWKSMPPDLLMGQSASTLLPSHQRTAGQSKFMRVQDFDKADNARAEEALKKIGRVLDIQGHVSQLKKVDQGVVLAEIRTADGPYEVVAQRVISAQGAGADRMLNAPHQPRPSGIPRYGEFTTGVKSLTGETPMVKGARVLVVGDGPTALWSAWHYHQNGCDVYVLGPPSDKAFAGANPGGRNNQIMQLFADQGRLLKGAIQGTEGREFGVANDPSEAGILVYIDGCERYNGKSGGKSSVLPITRLVSAIGTEVPSNLYNIDRNLISNLSPMVDPGLLKTDPVGVALVSDDTDVVVTGAQAVSLAAKLGYKDFVHAGRDIQQPNVGIGTNERNMRTTYEFIQALRQGIGAAELLGKVQVDLFNQPNLHPQTASSVEIARYLRDRGVDFNAAVQMTEQVMQARTQHREFGDKEFAETITPLLAGNSVIGSGSASSQSSAPSQTSEATGENG